MRAAPSRRASTVNGAGPSVLSKSFSVYNDTYEHDPASDPEFEPANQDFDYDPPPNDSPPRTGTSSNEVNQEEEDDEDDAAEVEKEVTSQAKKKVDKGKRRAGVEVEVEQQEENGVDEDIAQGLEEVENAPDEEDDRDPPLKKPRKERPKEQKLKKPRASRAPKRVITPLEESTSPLLHYGRKIHPPQTLYHPMGYVAVDGIGTNPSNIGAKKRSSMVVTVLG
jgi:centromere protein C